MAKYPNIVKMIDFVKSKLIEQGERSMGFYEDKSGVRTLMCAYRGGNNDESGNQYKCAVGHLIPDDLYYKDLENVTPLNFFKGGRSNKFGKPFIDHLRKKFNIDESFSNHSILLLLREMQSIHDDSSADNIMFFREKIKKDFNQLMSTY